jgi:hypothetical protein
MRYQKAFLYMVAATALLWNMSLATAQPKGPRIEVTEERFDLGTIVEGTEAVHVFAFRNVGDEELTIQKVQTS